MWTEPPGAHAVRSVPWVAEHPLVRQRVRLRRPTRVPARAERRATTGFWVAFLLLHVPLAIAIKSNGLIATAHAVATFAVAFGSLHYRTSERVLLLMGYAVAAEPLWRVGHASVFYEFSKYLIGSLSFLAVVRFRLLPRSDKTPLLYFLLLLPSLMMVPYFDRSEISFNLSGPFSLAMTTLYLSTQRISIQQLRKLLLVVLAPILGLAFMASFSTVTTEITNFYSSKIAAGGLGKNQASSVLGLGLLLALLFLVIDRHDRRLRWFVAAIGLWCGGQGMLTFSRGGIATALGAAAAASLFLLGDRKAWTSLMLRAGFLALLAVYVVLPQLNAFTGGMLVNRFSDSDLTGRDRIIAADVKTFAENPLLGVGPGRSRDYRMMRFNQGGITHTEYSRLLAEHGSFGLVALLLLVWMAVKRLRRRSTPMSLALAAAFTVWALLFMFHAAMRMGAVSFFFGLGAAHFIFETSNPPLVGRRVSSDSRRRPSLLHNTH